MEKTYLADIEAVGNESPDFWVKVHAIEFLIDLGYREKARELAEKCRNYEDSIPQRIGYWRMMYRVDDSPARENWLQKIRSAYLNTTGNDRIHAAETLAKLGISLRAEDPSFTSSDLKDNGALGAYVAWGMAILENGGTDYEAILDALEGVSPVRKRVAAYALTFTKPLPAGYAQRLFIVAKNEAPGSDALPYLLHAAHIQEYGAAGGNPDRDGLVNRLYQLVDLQGKEGPISFCKAVAAGRDSDSEAALNAIYARPLPESDSANAVSKAAHDDVRIAAAYALIALNK